MWLLMDMEIMKELVRLFISILCKERMTQSEVADEDPGLGRNVCTP